MLNGHGDDIYNHGKEIVINFSSNIYTKTELSSLEEFLCSRISYIHSYPEPDAISLIKMLSEKYNINEDNICVTNGATEAIYLISQEYRNKKAAICIPTFAEYEDSCKVNGLQLSFIHSLKELKEDIDIVWICNPNNPTGKVLPKEQVIEYIEKYPNTIFAIDQSYEFFTEKELLTVSEGVQYTNVILLHSMTKNFAIPGLRLGYITTHKELMNNLMRYKMPWSVNALALEAGKYLLENNLFQLNIEDYLKECQRFRNRLSEINGLEVFPTDTHFFLCELTLQKAKDLKEYLIQEYGILIRDAANFRGLNEHFFRLATQSPEENDLLVKAIEKWM